MTLLSELESFNYAVHIIFIATISLVIALVKGTIWEHKFPEKLGFTWGYFFIFSTVLGNGLLFVVLFLVALDEGEVGAALLCAGVVALLGFCAVKALQRRRWALVSTTLLSFNLLWALINLFYLSNRWLEFAAERIEEEGSDVDNKDEGATKNAFERRIREMSKSWRLATFCAVAWVLVVAVFVAIFKPYGSTMYDDDIVHMVSTMFLPTGLALGLYWIYERFVR